jgi:LEA14-like dessication related protein
MYFNYGGAWAGGHDVIGANQASTEWYFAEGTTRQDFDMWLCLQNPNPGAITVDATYMFGPDQGPNLPQSYTLQPNSRTTIKVDDVVGEEKDVSVKITSASDFIAERPMYFNYGGAWAGGHDVIGANQASAEWYFAEGVTGYSFQEYICLQNPHAEVVTVDLTFMMTKGEIFSRKVSLPPNSRTTVDLNRYIGFNGSSDMVAAHPYKAPAEWDTHYSAVVQALAAKGAYHEVVCTEIGWPHASDNMPGYYSEADQAAALGATGVGGLFDNGCKKIWIYRDLDEPPGTSWDEVYYGLFDYMGNPHPAWGSYKSWQSQIPHYPKLPSSI